MTEFGLIDHIKDLFSAIPTNNFEGIGDDCAVMPLEAGQALVFTSDMLIEDIHFLRAATSAYDLGYKSLAVNLSDVAAMGVSPVASLLSLSLPKELMGEFASEFMRGYRDLSQKYGVALIGGDTTASKDRLSINVTAIGRGDISHLKRRSAAQVGDVIVVSGPLGESAAGLQHLLAGRYDTPLAKIHKLPEPEVALGAWLGARDDVHAMMDISDGIASDLRHILKASRCGASVEISAVPTSVDIHSALCGGEDYKLLFTVAAEGVEQLIEDYRSTFNADLFVIGEIQEGEQLTWLRYGAVIEDDLMGFRHY